MKQFMMSLMLKYVFLGLCLSFGSVYGQERHDIVQPHPLVYEDSSLDDPNNNFKISPRVDKLSLPHLGGLEIAVVEFTPNPSLSHVLDSMVPYQTPVLLPVSSLPEGMKTMERYGHQTVNGVHFLTYVQNSVYILEQHSFMHGRLLVTEGTHESDNNADGHTDGHTDEEQNSLKKRIIFSIVPEVYEGQKHEPDKVITENGKKVTQVSFHKETSNTPVWGNIEIEPHAFYVYRPSATPETKNMVFVYFWLFNQ